MENQEKKGAFNVNSSPEDLVSAILTEELMKGDARYSLEHDAKYVNLELKKAAICVLNQNPSGFPEVFGKEKIVKWIELPYKKRLAIAANLLVSELRRVLAQEIESSKIKEDVLNKSTTDTTNEADVEATAKTVGQVTESTSPQSENPVGESEVSNQEEVDGVRGVDNNGEGPQPTQEEKEDASGKSSRRKK